MSLLKDEKVVFNYKLICIPRSDHFHPERQKIAWKEFDSTCSVTLYIENVTHWEHTENRLIVQMVLKYPLMVLIYSFKYSTLYA